MIADQEEEMRVKEPTQVFAPLIYSVMHILTAM